MRPSASDYAPAHAGYVALVPEEDVLSAIEQQSSVTQKLLSALDDAKAGYRYAEGKWSIKEVLGHVGDAERILGYRALAVARGEAKPLPGFDEAEYARNAHFDNWKIGDLLEQYALVRRTTIVFLRNLPEDAWDRRGIANGYEVSVRGMAYVILGHERHHLQILRDRYGVK
jgi:hypothetical protein